VTWQTVLTDLAGNPLSELAGATEREIAIPVTSMATAKAALRSDHEDADVLLTCDTVLKVYEQLSATDAARAASAGATVLGDGRLLHFAGRQVTGEETGGARGSKITATWADPFWTLMRRLCGKGQSGYTRGSALAMVDPGTTIIPDLVVRTNDESPTGLRMGTWAASTPTFVTGWFFKPIGEAIAELSATLFGPDWRVRPIEPVSSGGPLAIIGELDVLPVIGQARPDAVWEYGDGLLNVAGYSRMVSMEGVANRAFHLPPGFPNNDYSVQAVMLEETDGLVSQATRGLLETVVSQDLNVDDLRRKLLRYHIAVRSDPRQTITFDPVRDLGGQRIPRFGIDFNAGDVMPFRASIRRGGQIVKRINATFRAYQYFVSIDTEGAVSPTITMAPG
jgi:hypothetical protein